jgi:hypothetical protein
MFIINLKKLNDIEVGKQYQDEISERFGAVKKVKRIRIKSQRGLEL